MEAEWRVALAERSEMRAGDVNTSSRLWHD